MFYVYILKDLKGKLYIGYSSNLKKRVLDHQQKRTFTTRKMSEPKLIYYEAYLDKEEAQKREKKLKQFGSAYTGLLKRIGLR